MKNYKSLLQVVNSFPTIAKDALENVYHGKVYIVGSSINGHIEGCFKTRRGAEGKIKRAQSVSYYDDYTKSMVTCGSGLIIEEIDANDILDPKTSKRIWYKLIREYHGQDYMYNTVINQAKYIGVSDEIMNYVTTTIDELKKGEGLTIIDEFEDDVEVIEVSAQVDQENESDEPELIATEAPEPIKQPEPKQPKPNKPVSNVIEFAAKKADKFFDKMTPEQKLKQCFLSQLLGNDTIAEAIMTGVSIDELFNKVAEFTYNQA